MPPRALPLRGDVLLKAIQRVLLAIGGTGPFFIILLLIVGAVSSDTLNIFLACGIELFNDEDVHNIEVIAIVIAVSIVVSAISWSIAAWRSEVMADKASSSLHSQMLSGLLKTRLSFYRETPRVQITKRLRKINHVLYDELNDTLYRLLRCSSHTNTCFDTDSRRQVWYGAVGHSAYTGRDNSTDNACLLGLWSGVLLVVC